jgi:hypothetical protein
MHLLVQDAGCIMSLAAESTLEMSAVSLLGAAKALDDPVSAAPSRAQDPR